MPVLRTETATRTNVRDGLSRRLVHAKNLMMVVIDFTNGPWPEPETLQSHIHEQTTYVAAGEILFFCEGEKEQQLKAGDMFWVPSNLKHGIQLLSERATLVDSFNPIRKDFI